MTAIVGDTAFGSSDFAIFSALLIVIVMGRVLYLAVAQVPVDVFGFWAIAPLIGLCVPALLWTAYRGFTEGALAVRGIILFLLAFSYTPEVCAAVFHSGRAFPFVDTCLAAWDEALGFDWVAYVRFVDERPILWALTSAAYCSINIQPAFIIVVLAWTRSAARLYAFFLALALQLTVVATVALVLPALGTFVHFASARAGFIHRDFATAELWTKPIAWLRQDVLSGHGVDFFALISFPSLHAACAVTFAWATWRVPIVRWLMLALNAVMMASTPVQGSHYFVDLIAGAALAVLTIFASTRAAAVSRALSRGLWQTLARWQWDDRVAERVIASGAKRSSGPGAADWIASPAARNDGGG